MGSFLFVCTAFAPKNVIGSVRPTKIAKYLVRAGHDVTVVMPELPPDEPRDSLLMTPEMERVRVISVPYGKTYHRIRGRYRQGAGREAGAGSSGGASPLKQLARFVYGLYSEACWARRARKLLVINLPDRPFDAVFSTYPNLGTHWVAAQARRRGLARRWVADFRDPMVYDWQNSLQRQLNRRLQGAVERRCDAAVIVSRDAMEKFPVSGKAGKLHWIPNGFDPEDLAGIADDTGERDIRSSGDRQLVLSYAGGLYGGKRDLTALFSVLRGLMDEGQLPLNGLLFRYAGGDEGVLRGFAEAAGLADSLECMGRVSRAEALRMQRESDAVVVCSHNSRQDRGIMTGKAYEALMLGRPVVTLVNGDLAGSELGQMMKDVNAGVVYEEAECAKDAAALRDFLLGLYRQKTEKGATFQPMDQERKAEYAYNRIAGKMLKLLTGEAV